MQDCNGASQGGEGGAGLHGLVDDFPDVYDPEQDARESDYGQRRTDGRQPRNCSQSKHNGEGQSHWCRGIGIDAKESLTGGALPALGSFPFWAPFRGIEVPSGGFGMTFYEHA
jgi:hypothetical protein